MAFTISVRPDFTAAQRLLLQTDRNVRTAAARALNRIGDKVKTRAVRSISASYNITQARVRERIHVRKAWAAGDLAVEVSVRSKWGRRATNLITFGAKPIGKRGGVRVKIRRDRPAVEAPKWFIITNRKTRGTFVARRTGPGRKDIKSVTSIDVGQMFNARKVNEQLRAVVQREFAPEFERHLRYLQGR